jgi:hypothetical protein
LGIKTKVSAAEFALEFSGESNCAEVQLRDVLLPGHSHCHHAVSFAVTDVSFRSAAVLINYDPNGDGTSNGDVQLALAITGAPEISLPFGYSIE